MATVRRYGQRLLRVGAGDSSTRALDQRRVAIAALEPPKKGNPELRGRRLFTSDELELFATAVRRYAEMGFGLDVTGIASMMNTAQRFRVSSEEVSTWRPVHRKNVGKIENSKI